MTLNEAHQVLSEVADSHMVGVYHCRSWGTRFEENFVSALESVAMASQNGKARLCLHPAPNESQQEMLVVLTKDCVDQIHLHPDKGETVLWVKGSAEHRTFTMSGSIVQETLLGPSHYRYLHTPAGVPHHVVVKSDLFVFWEFARGPFGPNSTVPVEFSEKSVGG